MQGKFLDRSGLRYTRLVALERAGKRKQHTLWKCRCDCGNITVVTASNLSKGNTTSCGCLHKELLSAFRHVHGMANKCSEYNIWSSMRARCNNPKTHGYENYGGRGIKVCLSWNNSFVAFIGDMGNRPSIGHSIDRVDVNGNYEPSNCRWATGKEQSRNRRNNSFVDYLGKKITKAEAAELIGKPRFVEYYWQEFINGSI